jgi:hypothetical protein
MSDKKTPLTPEALEALRLAGRGSEAAMHRAGLGRHAGAKVPRKKEPPPRSAS